MRNKRISWAAISAAILMAPSLASTTGCGVVANGSRSYPNHAFATTGGKLFVEPIMAIVDNSDLSDAQQRQALRDELGIEDEDLISALLTVPNN